MDVRPARVIATLSPEQEQLMRVLDLRRYL